MNEHGTRNEAAHHDRANQARLGDTVWYGGHRYTISGIKVHEIAAPLFGLSPVVLDEAPRVSGRVSYRLVTFEDQSA